MVWNNCLKVFEQIVEPQQFNTWFRPVKPVAMEDATLTVEVPSEFFREYLEEYFLDMIKKVMKREIGADAKDIDRLTEKLLAGKETEGNYVKLKAEDVKCIYRSVCED